MCAVCSYKSYGEEYSKYYLDIFESLMRKTSDMTSDIVTSWLNDCWSQDTWCQRQEVCVCPHLHSLLTTWPHIQTLLQRRLQRIAQAVGSEMSVATTATRHQNANSWSLVPASHPGILDNSIVPLVPITPHFTSQHIPQMLKHRWPTPLVHGTSKTPPTDIAPIARGPFQSRTTFWTPPLFRTPLLYIDFSFRFSSCSPPLFTLMPAFCLHSNRLRVCHAPRLYWVKIFCLVWPSSPSSPSSSPSLRGLSLAGLDFTFHIFLSPCLCWAQLRSRRYLSVLFRLAYNIKSPLPDFVKERRSRGPISLHFRSCAHFLLLSLVPLLSLSRLQPALVFPHWNSPYNVSIVYASWQRRGSGPMTVQNFTTVDHVNLLLLFALCSFYCCVVIQICWSRKGKALCNLEMMG